MVAWFHTVQQCTLVLRGQSSSLRSPWEEGTLVPLPHVDPGRRNGFTWICATSLADADLRRPVSGAWEGLDLFLRKNLKPYQKRKGSILQFVICKLKKESTLPFSFFFCISACMLDARHKWCAANFFVGIDSRWRPFVCASPNLKLQFQGFLGESQESWSGGKQK